MLLPSRRTSPWFVKICRIWCFAPNSANFRRLFAKRKNGKLPDLVFRTELGKFQAVVREAKERYQRGQPVLIGTVSIKKNELLSKMLQVEGVPHEVLNAKNHEREALIIAQAGRSGAVTIATNMAGRGVDIILGGNSSSSREADEVRKAGGLRSEEH